MTSISPSDAAVLNHDISDIRDMVNDLGELVTLHDIPINTIDDNIQHTYKLALETEDNLEMTKKNQRSLTTKKAIIYSLIFAGTCMGSIPLATLIGIKTSVCLVIGIGIGLSSLV